MVTLKTNWVDGDILIAGTTASTSGVNGICYEINGKMKTVITSNNVTVVDGSTSGGTLGIYTIPAGTVRTGVVIMGDAYVAHYSGFDKTYIADISIQAGPPWAVVTKKTLRGIATGHVPILYTETGQNWSVSDTVIKIISDISISVVSSTLNSVVMLGY